MNGDFPSRSVPSSAMQSRAESGEKSTPWMLLLSLCEKNFRMSLRPTQTPRLASQSPLRSICHPWAQRDTRHPGPSLPLSPFVCRLPLATLEPPFTTGQEISPFAENVTACTQLPTLISIAGFNDHHQRVLHLSVRGHQRHNVAEQW